MVYFDIKRERERKKNVLFTDLRESFKYRPQKYLTRGYLGWLTLKGQIR